MRQHYQRSIEYRTIPLNYEKETYYKEYAYADPILNFYSCELKEVVLYFLIVGINNSIMLILNYVPKEFHLFLTYEKVFVNNIIRVS